MHNKLDELLQYDCWLASEDVRFISTGLGFGAVKENWLIKAVMNEYETYKFPAGVNSDLDTIVIKRELTTWKKSNQSQIINNIMLVGMNDYGKYARHLATISWKSEEEQLQRQKEILTESKLKYGKFIRWKFKCFMRTPIFIDFFDKRKGHRSEKIYTFCAYDLLDYGIVHYIKRLLRKITGDNN